MVNVQKMSWKRGCVCFAVLVICMIWLTSCGGVYSQDNSSGATEAAIAVTDGAVTGAAITEDTEVVVEEDTVQKDEEVESDNESNSGICPTTELELKKMNYQVTETRLIVPGYSNYFYVKNNGEIVADDWRSVHMDPPAISFTLENTDWREKKTPFDKARAEGKITHATYVTQRDNGDFVFINGMTELVRMTEEGKIKYKTSVEKLFSHKRMLIVSMAYLGDGKAIVQSQDDYFSTNVYAEQDASIIHLDLVNMKTGKIEKSYFDEWRLCGVVDENYFFAEKDKKIIKVDVNSGEIVKKYSTEAIWSQGWTDMTVDEEGVWFHNHPITWCTFEGKLYAKHVGGVFQLDEEKPCWKQLISREDNFKMGPMYNNVFVMLEENKMMLMAYRCDDESATDCCIYEWE